MKYIDLTHAFKASMPAYPGDTEPELKQIAFIEDAGHNNFELKTGLHVGTHIDAPLHMLKGGKALAEYPVEHFFGPGHILDARGKAIDAALLKGKQIAQGDIVFILTGWSKTFGTPAYYADYPEISEEFAQAMVELGVKIVGTDTPSPDRPPFSIHKILLEHDILIIENLTNLEELLAVPQFAVAALPIKLEAEAAPVRVVASIRL